MPDQEKTNEVLQQADFTERQNYPFMVGVFLAINAISDAFLLVDGPDCAHMKTQYIQGNHDWLSTLTDISGFHRVANTALHPFHMARSREEELLERLATMSRYEPAGVVLISPMPMAAITGVDYDRLTRLAASGDDAHLACPLGHVPGRSLSGDWLSGYALTLTTLANTFELEKGAAKEDHVAIVGYLMDRNEGDHRANIRDLKRLLEEVGLKLCSTWLSGESVEELLKVKEASAIISLPYGRRAARILAKKLDVPLIRTDLPFGLDGSARWLRTVAAATNREKQAEALIERELVRTVPALQWVVPSLFLHRRVSFIGDPHLLSGFLDLTQELGCRRGPMIVTARQSHAEQSLTEGDEIKKGLEIHFEPTRQEMMSLFEPIRSGAVDVIVTNSSGSSLIGGSTPVVEFGFPSYFTHALYDRPFLGFAGALAFIDSMANALRRIDLMRKHLQFGQEAPPQRSQEGRSS